MPGRPPKYTSRIKAQVALAAIKGEHTANEIASTFQVHPAMVSAWKKQLLQNLQRIFEEPSNKGNHADVLLRDQLYQQIGRLKMELEWLKKKSGCDA